VIGVPGESTIPQDDGRDAHNGEIVVLRGSASGLTTSGSKAWTQNTAGVPGTAEFADEFGTTLAAGDVNEDGRADVAIGTPFEAIGSRDSAGNVTILRGAASGLTATGAQSFSQDTAGIPGTAEAFDHFGMSVLLADRTGDGAADLVVGVPWEGIGTASRAGVVVTARSNGTSIVGSGAVSISQSTSGVPGSSESSDEFGSALRLLPGRVLAVGVPSETIGTVDDAGSLVLLTLNTSAGVTAGMSVSAGALVNGTVGENFGLGAPLV